MTEGFEAPDGISDMNRPSLECEGYGVQLIYRSAINISFLKLNILNMNVKGTKA